MTSASVAMSWKVIKMLTQKPRAVIRLILFNGSVKRDMVIKLAAMPDCPKIIQGLRRPMGKNVNRSINEATRIFKLNGEHNYSDISADFNRGFPVHGHPCRNS